MDFSAFIYDVFHGGCELLSQVDFFRASEPIEVAVKPDPQLSAKKCSIEEINFVQALHYLIFRLIAPNEPSPRFRLVKYSASNSVVKIPCVLFVE
jgi:hypothetical protein